MLLAYQGFEQGVATFYDLPGIPVLGRNGDQLLGIPGSQPIAAMLKKRTEETWKKSKREIEARLRVLALKRTAALQAIIAPARAAANQMLDAGMKRGADPLVAALFKYDAIHSTMPSIPNRKLSHLSCSVSTTSYGNGR